MFVPGLVTGRSVLGVPCCSFFQYICMYESILKDCWSHGLCPYHHDFIEACQLITDHLKSAWPKFWWLTHPRIYILINIYKYNIASYSFTIRSQQKAAHFGKPEFHAGHWAEGGESDGDASDRDMSAVGFVAGGKDGIEWRHVWNYSEVCPIDMYICTVCLEYRNIRAYNSIYDIYIYVYIYICIYHTYIIYVNVKWII